MISLATPHLCGNESKYLQECIASTFVSSVGPFVTRFEENVATVAGTKSAVAVSSGTAGLHTALLTVGVRPGDLVILPSFTFIASSNAIAHCGASPWLFDVDLSTWSIDVSLLQEKLKTETLKKGDDLIHKSSGRRIAALMPVYTLGLPVNLEDLGEIAKSVGLPIVADAAPAIGAQYKGKPLGDWADLTVFSFNGNKTVTAGAGGAIAGHDEKYLKLAKHLSTTARKGLEYEHDRVGYNYRMTNLQAAVGCAQLENLSKFVEIKKRIRKNYDEAFKDIPGVGLFPKGERDENVCWFSGVTLEDPKLPSLTEICEALKKEGIEARSFWRPVHLQEPYKNAPRTEQKISESIFRKILTLPSSTHLADADQKHVVTTLKKVLNRET